MNYKEEIEKAAIKRANGIYPPTQRDLRYINCKIDYSAGAESMLPIIKSKDARIAELEKANEWVKVEDRLPENRTNVLVVSNSGNVHMAEFKHGLFIHEDGVSSVYNPTHWRTLPQPPKE